MNVVSMKKKLLAGEHPGDARLTDKQIRYLAATVPCVKIHNSNACQYYFPDAGVYLQVIFHGGYRGSYTEGSLFKVPHDYGKFYYEDGTRKYLLDEKLKPVVFRYPAESQAIAETLIKAQTILWLEKKPYHVKIEGYETVHKKGWPRDKNYGTYKTSLHFRDGDFESVYLVLDEIYTHHGHGGVLKEAIVNGEYDGSESPREFEERITNKAQRDHEAWEYKYNFEQFLKGNPIEQINKAIEEFNGDINMYKKFLKMATELRRKMKANPGWFRKIKKVKKDAGFKNSYLYRQKIHITETRSARRKMVNNDHDIHALKLHYKIESAINNY